MAFGATATLGAYVAQLYWPRSVPDQWEAVGSVATVVGAGAAIAGLAALLLIYHQSEESRRRFRVELGPYLRVDFGPATARGTWEPPPDAALRNILTAANISDQRPDLGALSAWPGDVEICIWLKNLQEHPAGIAHAVEVVVLLRFTDPADPAAEQTLELQLRIAYLEPGQHIRYLVASVSADIPTVRGEVTKIRYLDLYERELAFAHGSAEFRMERGKITNERHVFRGESDG